MTQIEALLDYARHIVNHHRAGGFDREKPKPPDLETMLKELPSPELEGGERLDRGTRRSSEREDGQRERERERERHTHTHIYIYIYTLTDGERVSRLEVAPAPQQLEAEMTPVRVRGRGGANDKGSSGAIAY